MLPALPKKLPPTLEEPYYYHRCLTLRQFAIIVAIVIFVITATITFGAFMGKRHADKVIELVEFEIENELQRHPFAYNLNEMRLRQSSSTLPFVANLMLIATCLGTVNLIFAGIMIYGVGMASVCYIIPWIILSALTYLAATLVLVFGYFELMPAFKLSSIALVIAFPACFIFVELWYVIVLYYVHLKKKHAHFKHPRVVVTVGGIQHTVHHKDAEKA